MKILIQVLKQGQFEGRTAFSEQIEGTPQYCAGYEKGIKDANPFMLVVTSVLDEKLKKEQ